jgi:hypothetical protein
MDEHDIYRWRFSQPRNMAGQRVHRVLGRFRAIDCQQDFHERLLDRNRFVSSVTAVGTLGKYRWSRFDLAQTGGWFGAGGHASD